MSDKWTLEQASRGPVVMVSYSLPTRTICVFLHPTHPPTRPPPPLSRPPTHPRQAYLRSELTRPHSLALPLTYGRPTFERSESQLIKPPHHCIDLRAFSVELAHRRAEQRVRYDGRFAVGAWSLKPYADKSIDDLRLQASCVKTTLGLLSDLVVGTRGPPLSPADFDVVIDGKAFTNGADVATVKGLYRQTATAILSSTPILDFSNLSWGTRDWSRLGAALPLCLQLRALCLVRMEGMHSTLATAELPVSLESLTIFHCPDLVVLPAELSRCHKLTTLAVGACTSLTALPELRACTCLTKIDLHDDTALLALPSLDGLMELQRLDLQDCTALSALPSMDGCRALKRIELNGCSQLATIPTLAQFTLLRRLGLRDCPLLPPQDLSPLGGQLKVDGLTNNQMRVSWGRPESGGLLTRKIRSQTTGRSKDTPARE